MCNRKNSKKPKARAKKSFVEVLSAEKVTPPLTHISALARAYAVTRSAGGVCRGSIPRNALPTDPLGRI